MAVLVALAALASGCSARVALYRDPDLTRMRDRTIAVVDSALQPPLTAAQLGDILDRVEAGLRTLPRVQRLITRREMDAIAAADFRLSSDYQVYTDTLSIVSVSDRELAEKIGRASGAHLLFNAQAFFVSCTYCIDGDSAYLVGQIVDVATGRLLLRADLTAHPARNDQARAEAFATMGEGLIEELRVVLTPRPYLERFRGLALRHSS